jgi:hypothetical protein
MGNRTLLNQRVLDWLDETLGTAASPERREPV